MGKRAQGIPSWPGVINSTKAVYICADQPVILTFCYDEAADHTFRVARCSGAFPNGVWIDSDPSVSKAIFARDPFSGSFATQNRSAL